MTEDMTEDEMRQALIDHTCYAGESLDDGKPMAIFESWSQRDELETIARHQGYTLQAFLEKFLGEDCEDGFNDEYDVCSDCGRIVTTTAQYYGWTPYYVIIDDEIVCRECVDPEEYIEHIKNRLKGHSSAMKIDLEKHGWTKVAEDFETGLHVGQNDDPKKILAKFKTWKIDLIFEIFPGQFDVSFDLWVQTKDIGRAKLALKNNKDLKYPAGQDPGSLTEKALRGACKNG